MSAHYYVLPTEYGLSLMAKAHQGQAITLKNLVLGDANLKPYTPENRRSFTSLVNERASVKVQQIQAVDAKTIRVSATIPSRVGGFFIHEIGLTDINDKLIYVGNYHGGYKPLFAEGAGSDMQFHIDIKVENTANIAIIANDSLLANQDWVRLQLSQLSDIINARLIEVENRKVEDVALGDVLLTAFDFPNGDAVAKHKGYGRWKRFGDGQDIATLRHSAPIQGAEFLSNIGKTGGAYTVGRKNENLASSIVAGAWLRIPELNQFLELSADVQQVSVGQTVEFTLKTSLPPYLTVPYRITGVTSSQISRASLDGFLTIDSKGTAKLSLRASEDYVATGDKTLLLSIVDSQLSASIVVIDSGVTEVPTNIYYAGTHHITVEPNQIATFDLFAGGGGGGGSRWTTFRENNDGQDGANVVLTLDNANLTAGGGRKGTEGWWGNGSHYGNGSAGAGGNNNVIDDDGLFEILVNQRGTDARIYPRYETQRGAEVVAEAMAGSNAGGNGGNGVGDERWSYGGAGGSGGRIKARYTNNSESAVTIQIQIGQTAKGGQHQSKGGDGGFAYATVSII